MSKGQGQPCDGIETPYPAPEHRGFVFEPTIERTGATVGALLIHGFTGTAKEMRPLGAALAAAGVAAHGVLLPGFGPDAGDLTRTSAEDWWRATNRAWDEIVATYEIPVLVGFSMGAALALSAAARLTPARVVLLAPLARVASGPAGLLVPLLPVLKRVLPDFRPFASADFDDPQMRALFTDMHPDQDLDDPATQHRLREGTTVPMAVVDQLRRVVAGGVAAAPRVSVPALVLQALSDEVTPRAVARRLLPRLGGPVTYREVPGDHLIVSEAGPSWPVVRDVVVSFVDGSA
ncbi:MAG: alpha/beta fold hydrolase [Chloroflexia bacterium]|nr:alpha/beta fold hydrolase [Chloroflexia bacterium]